MSAKDQAEIYRNMARVFSGMNPRYQQMQYLPAGQGQNQSSNFAFPSQQGAMWDTFSALGRAFSVLADQYELAAKTEDK